MGMRVIEAKAVRLVNERKVIVDLYQMADDGTVLTTAGHLTSGDNLYWVTITPDGSNCTCTYGVNQPGRRHSHDLALELETKRLAKEEPR
jgi:hypothetical protein